MDIPKINYKKIVNFDRDELVRLRDCMIEIGFFKLYNHEVKDEIRINFQKIIKQFFDLSKADKNKVRQVPTESTKGYSNYQT